MTGQYKQQQVGSTAVGFVVGVVVGLACALAVAVYVTNVPVNFANKGQSRTPEQDAQEARKNKNWDPNAPLSGTKLPTTTSGAVATPPPTIAPPAAPAAPAHADSAAAKPKAADAASPKGADPLADAVKAKTEAPQPVYFVQVGAFRSQEEADGHRAKLSLTGVESKVFERSQGGSTVYRVRVGPFDKKDEAEKAKEKLDAAGVQTSLVTTGRSAP